MLVEDWVPCIGFDQHAACCLRIGAQPRGSISNLIELLFLAAGGHACVPYTSNKYQRMLSRKQPPKIMVKRSQTPEVLPVRLEWFQLFLPGGCQLPLPLLNSETVHGLTSNDGE